ncbi:MAG: GGDEF domain-containing protein [Spirochaetales bacterium]|jgi:diguanylate cyclase (GGDEF)-like protein|nr:GGDEF domain-containing protein [Spirochaetales bacterium]
MQQDEDSHMMDETLDLRPKLLKRLHPYMLGIVLIALLAVLAPVSYQNPDKPAYVILLLVLAVLLLASMAVLRKGYYHAGAFLTVGVSFLGTWVSFLINSRMLFCDFFPLVYVTGSIILSSLFLPLAATLVIIAAHTLLLVAVVLTTPILQTQNWPSFFIYILFVSLLSTIANQLIKTQLIQLRESSIRDHLTGLFNRRYFEETLKNKLKRAQGAESSLGIILLDVDHFKQFNDTYGHDAGDAVLTELANLMLRHFDITVSVCRYGGDEFAVLLSKTQKEELLLLAESLVKKVRSLSVMHKNKPLGAMTISCGYALHNRTEGLEQFIKRADQALYQAKEQGKDRVAGH